MKGTKGFAFESQGQESLPKRKSWGIILETAVLDLGLDGRF